MAAAAMQPTRDLPLPDASGPPRASAPTPAGSQPTPPPPASGHMQHGLPSAHLPHPAVHAQQPHPAQAGQQHPPHPAQAGLAPPPSTLHHARAHEGGQQQSHHPAQQLPTQLPTPPRLPSLAHLVPPAPDAHSPASASSGRGLPGTPSTAGGMLASVQATHGLLAPSAVGGGGHPPVSRALHPAHLSPPARHPLPRLEAPLRRLPPPPTLGGRDPLTRSLVPLSGGYGPAFSAPAYAGGPSSDPKRESALIPPGVPGPAPGPAPGPGASIKEYCAVLTPFIYKLYCLVSDESTNALCCWTGAGDSFIVQDPTRFAASVLPNYFKHNQFSSFVRQLNKYRFHKLAPGAFLFGHDRFIRGRPDLLPEIGRQRSPDRVEKPAQQPAAEYGKRAAPARFESAPEAAYKRARPEGQMGPGQGQGDPELRAEVARLHAELQQNEARTRQLEEAVAGLQHTVGFLQAQAAAAAHGAPSYPPRPASYGHPYGSGGLPPPPTSKR